MPGNAYGDAFSHNDTVKYMPSMGVFVQISTQEDFNAIRKLDDAASFRICPMDDCGWTAPVRNDNIDALIEHMKSEHSVDLANPSNKRQMGGGDGRPCLVCLKHEAKFPSFQTKYKTVAALKAHLHEQHAICGMCDGSKFNSKSGKGCASSPEEAKLRAIKELDFHYNDDEMKKSHYKAEHEACEKCKVDQRTDYWYPDYNLLWEHYSAEHFVCMEPACYHKKYQNIFGEYGDLEKHMGDEHPFV